MQNINHLLLLSQSFYWNEFTLVMNLLLWSLIFQWVHGQAIDPRCHDPPASEAAKLKAKRCMPSPGYSWKSSSNACVLEPNAGCADTRNKFKHQQRCLKPGATAECNGGFRPRPCPDAELRSVRLYYYDWNVEKCLKSHVQLCPGDQESLFSSQLNSFPSLSDCLNDCSTPAAKCTLPFGVTESYQSGKDYRIMYSHRPDTHQCQPFLYVGPDTPNEWTNRFASLEECQSTCAEASPPVSALDASMPNPQNPEPWQCTDVAALEGLLRNRSCLAYDNSNGYTFSEGECVPSDTRGCIDTYNKFRDMESCARTCLDTEPTLCEAQPSSGCESSRWGRRLAHPIRAFTYDGGRHACVPFDFDGCGANGNVFLDLGACLKACQS